MIIVKIHQLSSIDINMIMVFQQFPSFQYPIRIHFLLMSIDLHQKYPLVISHSHGI